MTHTLLSVVGARPNFLKLGPVARVLGARTDTRHVIVHTGQHYDDGMSASFFRDLAIPEPDHHLAVGSASHAQQTAAIMQRFEPILVVERPDWVLVYGDVNSTLAAALVAAKLGVRIAHVEAGLRSHDWSMPEEINRVITDRLSNVLFTPSGDARENLRAEGIPAGRVHFVGNVMADELSRVLPEARRLNAHRRHGLKPREYAVATFHRAGQVDDPAVLAEIVNGLSLVAHDVPVLFAVHPRTRARLEAAGLATGTPGLRLLPPLPYAEMLSLVAAAGVVITDSGGLQAETSMIGVPCLTVRGNTEWLVTLSQGTNQVIQPSRDAIRHAAAAILHSPPERGDSIERWDGQTARRIVGVLLDNEEYP